MPRLRLAAVLSRPQPVSRVLALIVLPLVASTAIGLVALWPRDRAEYPSRLGPRPTLAKGSITGDERFACRRASTEETSFCHRVTVRLGSGPDRGQSVVIELAEGPGEPAVRTGDRLILARVADPGGGVSYSFADFERTAPLLWLAVLYAAVVIGIGRVRGLTSLLGVGVTFVLLIVFVLPAILEGRSPVAVAVVGSAASMFVILYLAHGVSAKTTAALLGTLASLAITAVLAALFVDATRLLNLGTDETAFLQLSASQVNLQGVLLGGIIIGALGVLNDVTVTQASAVWALRAANPAAGLTDLYRSAMHVGRDHIASTVDTLVLAYAGASLPLLLLFSLAGRPVGEVLTGSLVAEEIVRTLVGGVGLAASVPITTAIAAFIGLRVGVDGSSPPGGDAPEATPTHLDDRT